MTLPKELTIVTPLSKTLAMVVFVSLPILGFFLGIRYQEMMDLTKRQEMESNLSITRVPTPTPIAIPTVDPSVTVNWKTYTNSEFGFSIEYPRNWILEAEDRAMYAKQFYIYKEKLSKDERCGLHISCLVITPSIGGRGDYMFQIKRSTNKYISDSFTGSRTDYFAYDNSPYSSYILIDPTPERPKWPDGVIDILPKILSEKYNDTGLPEPYNSRLDTVIIDNNDLKILNQILSTFRFSP